MALSRLDEVNTMLATSNVHELILEALRLHINDAVAVCAIAGAVGNLCTDGNAVMGCSKPGELKVVVISMISLFLQVGLHPLTLLLSLLLFEMFSTVTGPVIAAGECGGA